MKRIRCKPGDLALVIYDTPDCVKNVGRLVRIRGPLKLNLELLLECWLIQPLSPAPYYVSELTRTRRMVVKPTHSIEHPDRWLLPLRPPSAGAKHRVVTEADHIAERQARLGQVRIDRELYKERYPWILCPASLAT